MNAEFENYLRKNLVYPELQKIWASTFSQSEMEDYIRHHKKYLDLPDIDINEAVKLQFMDLSNLIVLRMGLVNDKDNYLQRFIAGGGIPFLLKLLDAYLETSVTEQVACALFEILHCCKLTLDKSEGIKEFLGSSRSTTAVAKCLIYEFKPLSLLALDVLAVCCFWEDSTSKVVKGLEERGRQYNEEPFEHLYKGLSAENMEITSAVMELIVRLFTDPMDSYCRKLVKLKLNKNTIKNKCDDIIHRLNSSSEKYSSKSGKSGHNKQHQAPQVTNPKLSLFTPYMLKVLFVHKEVIFTHMFELTPSQITQYKQSNEAVSTADSVQDKFYKIADIENMRVPNYSPYSETNFLVEITFQAKNATYENAEKPSKHMSLTGGQTFQQDPRTLVLGFERSNDQLQWYNAIHYYRNLLKVPEEGYFFYKKYLFQSSAHHALLQEGSNETMEDHMFYIYCINSFRSLYDSFCEILQYEKSKSNEAFQFDLNNIDELYDKLYEELLVIDHENYFLNLLQNCLSFSMLSTEKKKLNEKGWVHLVELSNRLVDVMKVDKKVNDETTSNKSSSALPQNTEEVFDSLVPLPPLDDIAEKIKLTGRRKTLGDEHSDVNDESEEGVDKETLYKQINKLAKLSVMQKQEISSLRKQLQERSGLGGVGERGSQDNLTMMKPRRGIEENPSLKMPVTVIPAVNAKIAELLDKEPSPEGSEKEEGGRKRSFNEPLPTPSKSNANVIPRRNSFSFYKSHNAESEKNTSVSNKSNRMSFAHLSIEDVDKYMKLKNTLPDAALRQRMLADGFSENQINSFFAGAATASRSKKEQQRTSIFTKAANIGSILKKMMGGEKKDKSHTQHPPTTSSKGSNKKLSNRTSSRRDDMINAIPSKKILSSSQPNSRPMSKESSAANSKKLDNTEEIKKMLTSEEEPKFSEKKSLQSIQENESKETRTASLPPPIDESSSAAVIESSKTAVVETPDVKTEAAAPAKSLIDPKFEKYEKMKKMLPEGSVRHKMKMDNIPDHEIDAFFAGGSVAASVKVNEDGETVDKKAAPPAMDPKFEKYDQMRKKKIPEGAIRQKMAMDKITPTEIELFFNPHSTGAPAAHAVTKKPPLPKRPVDTGPRFKPLHWQKLVLKSDQLKNTIFDEYSKKKLATLPDMNKTELRLLTSMFVDLNTIKNGKEVMKNLESSQLLEESKNQADPANDKKKEVTLLDAKGDLNIAVAVNKLPEKRLFLESMIECNSRVTKDDLDRLISVLPESDVVAKILGYPHYSELDKMNQFLHSCYDSIPFFQERCMVLQSMYNYHENMTNFKQLLYLYNAAYSDVLSIMPELKEIFLIILKIGNFLESGKPLLPPGTTAATGKGASEKKATTPGGEPSSNNLPTPVSLENPKTTNFGITFSAISKCYSLRSNKSNTDTLLHFILLFIANHYPKEIKKDPSTPASPSTVPEFTSTQLLDVFESQSNLRATAIDPFDKIMMVFNHMKREFAKLEKDLVVVKKRKEENLTKLNTLPSPVPGPAPSVRSHAGGSVPPSTKHGESKKPTHVDIRKLRLYDIAYDYLIEKVEKFLATNKAFYDQATLESKALYEKYDSLLEKFGEKNIQEDDNDFEDQTSVKFETTASPTGSNPAASVSSHNLLAGGSTSKSTKGGELKIKKFLAKFVKFIEHYELARADNKNNLKILQAELRKMDSTQHDEEEEVPTNWRASVRASMNLRSSMRAVTDENVNPGQQPPPQPQQKETETGHSLQKHASGVEDLLNKENEKRDLSNRPSEERDESKPHPTDLDHTNSGGAVNQYYQNAQRNRSTT
jgi:hypothetical protein